MSGKTSVVHMNLFFLDYKTLNNIFWITCTLYITFNNLSVLQDIIKKTV